MFDCWPTNALAFLLVIIFPVFLCFPLSILPSHPLLHEGELISFCYDIAAGMTYIASKGCVHRDLSARNCLVFKDLSVKVADFGLSRRVEMMAGYYRKSGEETLPFRWLAPECIMDGLWSQETDVWAFGVTMWEIWSLGHMPYPGWTAARVCREVINGYKLPPPDGTPEPVANLIRSCWNPSRPEFFVLKQSLAQLLNPMGQANSLGGPEPGAELENGGVLASDMQAVFATGHGGINHVAGSSKGMPSGESRFGDSGPHPGDSHEQLLGRSRTVDADTVVGTRVEPGQEQGLSQHYAGPSHQTTSDDYLSNKQVTVDSPQRVDSFHAVQNPGPSGSPPPMNVDRWPATVYSRGRQGAEAAADARQADLLVGDQRGTQSTGAGSDSPGRSPPHQGDLRHSGPLGHLAGWPGLTSSSSKSHYHRIRFKPGPGRGSLGHAGQQGLSKTHNGAAADWEALHRVSGLPAHSPGSRGDEGVRSHRGSIGQTGATESRGGGAGGGGRLKSHSPHRSPSSTMHRSVVSKGSVTNTGLPIPRYRRGRSHTEPLPVNPATLQVGEQGDSGKHKRGSVGRRQKDRKSRGKLS